MRKDNFQSGSTQPDAGSKDHQQNSFALANKGQLKHDDVVQLSLAVAHCLLWFSILRLDFVRHVVTPAGLCLFSNDLCIRQIVQTKSIVHNREETRF